MATKPRILVTTAAGKTGRAAAHQLLEKGYPVNAFVRKQDHRSEALAKAGAKIFVGNLIEPDDLRQAMHGVQRAYFCAPWTPEQLHGAMNFAVTAADTGLEVVVALTQWLAQPHHPSVATRQSYMTDRVFDWMPGVDSVTINAGWFADNYMAVLGTVAQLGVFPFPLGNGRTAPVSNEDIARVVVGALTNPAPHIGKYYRPTGPEILDPYQLAAVYAKVLKRPVKYQPLSDRMFLKALKVMGMEPHMMTQLRHYVEEYRRGAFEVGAPNDVVLEVGGSEPEDFETITRRYVAANSMARPSLANKVRAVGEFVKILLTRTPNLEAYERSRNHPLLRQPKYGLDYDPWLTPHSEVSAYGLSSAFNEGHTKTRIGTDVKLAEHPTVEHLRQREVASVVGNATTASTAAAVR
jgi:uncharacterized protein YbjT (DUF2867 family)